MLTIISIAAVIAAFCVVIYTINSVEFKKNDRKKKMYISATMIGLFTAIITALSSAI